MWSNFLLRFLFGDERCMLNLEKFTILKVVSERNFLFQLHSKCCIFSAVKCKKVLTVFDVCTKNQFCFFVADSRVQHSQHKFNVLRYSVPQKNDSKIPEIQEKYLIYLITVFNIFQK